MKFGSIKNKVFVFLVLITLFVVVSMALMVRFGVDRGFDRYKKSQEFHYNQNILQVLSHHYHTEGSWDSLREDAAIWRELLYHSAFKVVDRGPPHHKPQKHKKPPPKKHKKKEEAKFTMKRMLPNYSVYDAKKQKVVGPVEWNKKHQVMKIKDKDKGKVVGFLIAQDNKGLAHDEDKKFNQDVQRLLMIMAGVMIVVSLLLTIPVARYFTKPISELTQATKQATAGDFSVRSDIRRSDELGQLSNHFNHLVKTLEFNAQSQKNMMADIAHELRTPLAVTLAQIEAIQDGLHEADEKTLGILHHQIQTLKHLVNDLYELSLSDLGTMRYEMQVIDLLPVLKQSVNAFKLAFEQKTLDYEFVFSQKKHAVLADANRLSQLFNNVLNNAVQYTDEGGRVWIKVMQQKGAFLVVIEDSEPSLEPEQMAKMFDRLYRKESSRNKKSGGSGLGLAIASNIVNAHDGWIKASQSELGGVRIEMGLKQA